MQKNSIERQFFWFFLNIFLFHAVIPYYFYVVKYYNLIRSFLCITRPNPFSGYEDTIFLKSHLEFFFPRRNGGFCSKDIVYYTHVSFLQRVLASDAQNHEKKQWFCACSRIFERFKARNRENRVKKAYMCIKLNTYPCLGVTGFSFFVEGKKFPHWR